MPETEFNKDTVPCHVGIIMDGNGRWAQNKKLPRTAGHKAGVEVARSIIKAASEIGIKYLTLYTFSTENWKRPKDEVNYLMNLLRLHLQTEKDFYKKNNVRLLHAGDITGLSLDLQKEIKIVLEESKTNTGLNVVLAINYGGRDEVVRTVNKILQTDKKSIDEDQFSQFLDNPEVPSADLIIRTGGEQRLSNFLMWESAYSEFDFSNLLWPDYTKDDFIHSIEAFQKRNRRFGGTKEKDK